MAAGIEHARGEVIVTMDGDPQNDPADIANLLAKIDAGYDIVVGWRHERQDKLSHRLTSRAFGLPADSVEDGVRVVRVPVFFRRQLATANIPLTAAYLPLGFWRGLRLGRTRTFDIINTHFVVPTGPTGDWRSRCLQIPNVLSVHGGDLFDPSKPTSPHRHDSCASRLRTCRAGERRRRAIARYCLRSRPNLRRGADRGVGAARHRAASASRAGPPLRIRHSRERTSDGQVGRLVPHKATPQLVSVLAAAKHRDVYLLVVGDGPDTAEIQRVAGELGVSERVKLVGHVTERQKHAALRMSDLFVSTSQHEGFGLVFLEAMAFGVPVVCYDCGGQVDFLSTPNTGAVIKLNDVEAFARAVLDLHASPELRAEIRRHNLATVETYFIDRCVRRYESIFERAITARAGKFAMFKASLSE